MPQCSRAAVPPPVHAAWTGRDPSEDDTSLLQALNESYVKAFRDADVAWYAAHLAPDYVMVSGDGAQWDRAAALTRFSQPTFATAMRSFPVDKVTVRRFHHVALIHAENAYQLKDGRTGREPLHRHLAEAATVAGSALPRISACTRRRPCDGSRSRRRLIEAGTGRRARRSDSTPSPVYRLPTEGVGKTPCTRKTSEA